MAIKGRKRWAIYPRNESFLLYPNLFTDTFAVDPFKPVPDTFTLTKETSPWLFTLEPGELVLIPYGSPHAVRNIDDTMSIAGNYVDGVNFEDVKAEVKLRIKNPQSTSTNKWHKAMFDAMEDMEGIAIPTEQAPLAWAAFKRRG